MGRGGGPPPWSFSWRPRLLVGSDGSVPRFHSLQRPPPSTPPTPLPSTPSADPPRTTHATRRGRSGEFVSFFCRWPGRLVDRGQAGASLPAAPHHRAPDPLPLTLPGVRKLEECGCLCVFPSDRPTTPAGRVPSGGPGYFACAGCARASCGEGGYTGAEPPVWPRRQFQSGLSPPARCRTRPRVVRVVGGEGGGGGAGPPAGHARLRATPDRGVAGPSTRVTNARGPPLQPHNPVPRLCSNLRGRVARPPRCRNRAARVRRARCHVAVCGGHRPRYSSVPLLAGGGG